MRTLRVVGLDEGGTFVVFEDSHGERCQVPADEQLRAAARGDVRRLGQIEIELEHNMRPREIQARIRAGESVEHVAHVSSIPVQRVERYAYPVLLERARTTELAQQAHPIREDGPDVRTLGEVAGHAFDHWAQDYEAATWDSWRGEDGRWVVQLAWKTGRSQNRAHWAFAPGAHGGTVSALDERADHVLDPEARHGLRTVGGQQYAQSESEPLEDTEEAPETIPPGDPSLTPPVELVSTPQPELEPAPQVEQPEPAAAVTEHPTATEAPAEVEEPAPAEQPTGTEEATATEEPKQKAKGKAKKNHPAVPAWEDVLLGVRSNR